MALQAGNLPTGSRHKSSRAVYEPRVLRSASSTSASPSSSQRSYARKPEPLQSLLSSADQVFHLPAADGLSLGAAPAETRAADSQRSPTPGASSASAGPASSAASSFSDCLSELSLSSSHAAFSSPHATMTREGRGPALLALGGHSARLSRRSSDNETVPDSSYFMFPSPFSAAGEASAAGKHLPKSLPSFPPLPSSSPSDSPSTCAFSSSPSAGRSWAGGDREAKGEGERETGAGASLSPSSSPSLPSTRTNSPDKQGPAASCASRVLSIVPAPRLFSSSACSASSPPLSPPTASPAAPSLRASPVAAPLPAAAPSFSPLFGVAPAPSSSSLSSSFSSSSFASASAPAVCLPRSRTCSSLPSSLSQAHPLWRPPRAVDSPVASTSAPISPAVSRRVSPQSPAFAAFPFPPASPGLVAAEKSSVYYLLSPGNAASDVLSPPPDLLLSPVCSPLPPLLPKESEKSLLPPASSAAPAAAAAAAAPGTWRGREGDCKPLTGDVPQIFVHGRKLEKAPPASHAPSFFFPPPPSPFGGNASVLRLGAWLAERPGLEDDKFTPLLESFLLHFDFLAAAKTSKKLQDQQAQRYLLLDKEEEETDVSFFRPLAKPGGDAEKGPDAAAKDQLEEFETTLLDILGLRGGNGVHASVDILVGQLREKPHRHKPTGEDGGGENGGSAAGGIKIGEKFFFPDKVALKSRLRQILQAYDEKEELRGDDFELVKGVLEFHPKAKRKMQNMSGLFVSTHPNPKFRQTRCFFIRRLIHPPASASAAPAPALPSEGAPAGQVNPGTAEAATTEPREGPPSEKREETEEVGNGDRDKSEGDDAQEATKAEEKAEDARTKDAKAEEKKQEAKMEEEKGEGAKAEGQEGEPKEAKTDEGEGQKESEVKEGKGNQTELEKPDEPTEQVQEECEDFSYVRCVDNMLEDDSRADRLICHTLKQLAEAFPGCVAHLHEALRRSFPPLRFSVDVLVAYAKNLLWISQHVPQIRALLWKLLVSKMTSIDVEIKLADPNSIDLEQMQVWKREQLALLARQLEKGAVAPSVVQSILGEPQWFSLMYEKVRSEEDIDIMAAKLDGLMRVSFTFLQCFIPQLSGKPAAPGAYREDEDDDEDDESRRSPSSAPCTGDYSPCVDDEPKDEPKEGQRGSGGGLPAAEAARLRVENENALSPLPPDVFTPLLSAAPSPLIRASLHPIRTGGPSDAPVGLSPALLPARAPETGRGARAGLRGRGRGAQNEETRLRGRTEGGSKAKKPLTEADVFVYELMDVFVEVVLPVHKCKYVQFLIFYLANLRVEWAGRLMSLLFRMVFDRQQHVLLRRISAVYISSFLCRALLVPSRFVRLALHHFFQLLHRGFLMTGSRSAPRQQQRLLDLLRAQHQTVYNPESPLALFYTICQSCCYILCYHLDALANSSPSLSFLKERNTSLEALLVSPLRPLMHIKRGIAREFVAACRRVGMLDSSPEFENALKQVQLRDPPISSASCALGAGDKGEAIEEEKAARGDDVSRYGEATSNDLLSDVLWLFDPLDAFFPFDRYLLRHSERFISNKYRDWSAVVAFVMQREEEKKKLGAAGDGKRKSEQAEEEENEDREAPRALAQEVTQRGEGLREEGEGGRDCRKPDDGARRVDAAAEGKKGDGKREEGLDDDDDDILDTTGALSLTLEDESGSEAEKGEAREHEQAKDQHEEEGSGRASRERRLSVGSAGEERKNDAALPRGETEASHAPIVTQQPQHNLKPREHLTNSEMDALQQLVQDSLGFASASRELEASVRQRLGGLAGATAKKDERRAANLQDKRSLRPEEEAEGGDADGRRPSVCSGAGEPLRELAGLERQLREMSGLGLDEGSSEAAAEEPEEGEEEEGDDERSVGSESEEGDWGGGDTGEWASLSSLFSEDGHELEDDEATEGDEEEGARRAKQDGPSSTGCRGGKAKHELSFLAPGVAASIANQLELEIDALGDDALSQSNLRFLRNKSGLSRASMLDIFLSSHAYRPAPASPAPTPAASPFLGPSCAAIPVRDFPRGAKRRRGGGKGLEAPSSPPTLSVSGAPTEPPPADFVLAPSQVFLSPPGATPATRGDAEKAEGAAWEQRPSRSAQPGTLDDARESPQPPAVAPHAGGIAGHRRVRNISPMLLPSAPRSLEVLKEVEGEDEDDLEGDNERQQRQDSPGSERRAGAEREEEPEKGGRAESEGEAESGSRGFAKNEKERSRRRTAGLLDGAANLGRSVLEEGAQGVGEPDSNPPPAEIRVTRPPLRRRHTCSELLSGFTPLSPSQKPVSASNDSLTGAENSKRRSAHMSAAACDMRGLPPRRLSPETRREREQLVREKGEEVQGWREAPVDGSSGERKGAAEEDAGAETGALGEEGTDSQEAGAAQKAGGGRGREGEGGRKKKKRGNRETSGSDAHKSSREEKAEGAENETVRGADESDQTEAPQGTGAEMKKEKKRRKKHALALQEAELDERREATDAALSDSSPLHRYPTETSADDSLRLSSSPPLSLAAASLGGKSAGPSASAAPEDVSALLSGAARGAGRASESEKVGARFSQDEETEVSQIGRVLSSLREREEQLKAQQAEVQRTQEALMKMLLDEQKKREERRKKKEKRRKRLEEAEREEAETGVDEASLQAPDPCEEHSVSAATRKSKKKARHTKENEEVLEQSKSEAHGTLGDDCGDEETERAERKKAKKEKKLAKLLAAAQGSGGNALGASHDPSEADGAEAAAEAEGQKRKKKKRAREEKRASAEVENSGACEKHEESAAPGAEEKDALQECNAEKRAKERKHKESGELGDGRLEKACDGDPTHAGVTEGSPRARAAETVDKKKKRKSDASSAYPESCGGAARGDGEKKREKKRKQKAAEAETGDDSLATYGRPGAERAAATEADATEALNGGRNGEKKKKRKSQGNDEDVSEAREGAHTAPPASHARAAEGHDSTDSTPADVSPPEDKTERKEKKVKLEANLLAETAPPVSSKQQAVTETERHLQEGAEGTAEQIFGPPAGDISKKKKRGKKESEYNAGGDVDRAQAPAQEENFTAGIEGRGVQQTEAASLVFKEEKKRMKKEQREAAQEPHGGEEVGEESQAATKRKRCSSQRDEYAVLAGESQEDRSDSERIVRQRDRKKEITQKRGADEERDDRSNQGCAVSKGIAGGGRKREAREGDVQDPKGREEKKKNQRTTEEAANAAEEGTKVDGAGEIDRANDGDYVKKKKRRRGESVQDEEGNANAVETAEAAVAYGERLTTGEGGEEEIEQKKREKRKRKKGKHASTEAEHAHANGLISPTEGVAQGSKTGDEEEEAACFVEKKKKKKKEKRRLESAEEL